MSTFNLVINIIIFALLFSVVAVGIVSFAKLIFDCASDRVHQIGHPHKHA